MRYTLRLGTPFGIPLRVHATFPLVLVLYPAVAVHSGSWRDALPAVLLVLCVFVCVVLHELGHSLMARRYGIGVRDILLFPIGGVARAEAIPDDPRQEIAIAVAGPVVNFFIAGTLFSILALRGVPPRGEGFFADLAWVNLALGVFNLIPAFPMDGGRILRGMLSLRMPYLTATRRARATGQLIALGFAVLAFTNLPFAMLALIAAFIFAGGMAEEKLVRTRVRLEGRRAGELADSAAPVFALDDPVSAVLARIDGRPVYAVVGESGALAGVVDTRALMHAARAGRAQDALATLARFDFPVAESASDASHIHRFLISEQQPFAAVVEGDRFLGFFYANEIPALQLATTTHVATDRHAPRTAG